MVIGGQFIILECTNKTGCVAKIDGSLVEVVFVLIITCQAHLVHEPQAPFQVASLPIRAHPVVRPVVLTLPA
jgi:hypothetical protein